MEAAPQQQSIVFGPGDAPFLTDDSVLAFALYMAFADFFDNNQPCVNWYSMEKLRSLGFKGSGVLPADAAIEATKQGMKGQVDYIFKSLAQPQMVEWFKDQLVFLQKGEGFARDTVKSLMIDWSVGARTFEETMVRLICTIIYMRVEFITMWEKLEPLIQVDDGSAQKPTKENLPDGSILFTHPGFKFIGALASKETK